MQLDMEEVQKFIIGQFAQIKNGECRTVSGIYYTTIEKFNIPFSTEHNFTRNSIRQIILYFLNFEANKDMVKIDTLNHFEYLKTQRKEG